jgi:molecular chaperone GrpE
MRPALGDKSVAQHTDEKITPDTQPGEESTEKGRPETANESAEANVDSELMDLQFALGEAEKELSEHREAMLRMQAEMENLRKRLIRDLERSRKFALERVMSDLLPIVDSFERGLQADGDSTTVEALLEGKSLIFRMLGKTLGEHGLEELSPLGEVFDPEQHEAMTMQPSEEYPENTVMEVLQKGFRLHDRLLRPAMVVVSRGSAED